MIKMPHLISEPNEKGVWDISLKKYTENIYKMLVFFFLMKKKKSMGSTRAAVLILFER